MAENSIALLYFLNLNLALHSLQLRCHGDQDLRRNVVKSISVLQLGQIKPFTPIFINYSPEKYCKVLNLSNILKYSPNNTAGKK